MCMHSRLNLASFVTTWMEPEAEKLMMESLDVNYVDTEEYPSTTEIQNRQVILNNSSPGRSIHQEHELISSLLRSSHSNYSFFQHSHQGVLIDLCLKNNCSTGSAIHPEELLLASYLEARIEGLGISSRMYSFEFLRESMPFLCNRLVLTETMLNPWRSLS